MEGINLSSTASLGPEGIWAGNTTEYAPPTDLVQLSEQLNWMRQDLRRIELAFGSVYALKQACEKDLASLQARLDMGLKQSNDAVSQVGRDSQAALSEARSALDANRERLEALAGKQQAATDLLGTAQRTIFERLGGLDGWLRTLDGKIVENAAKSRVAFGNISDQGAATQESIRAMRSDLGAQQAIVGQAVEQSRNQILETMEAQRLALNAKLTEAWSRQSAGLDKLIAAQERDTFSIKQDISAMFDQIESRMWPMLWASFKNSLKRLFRRKQKT